MIKYTLYVGEEVVETEGVKANAYIKTEADLKDTKTPLEAVNQLARAYDLAKQAEKEIIETAIDSLKTILGKLSEGLEVIDIPELAKITDDLDGAAKEIFEKMCSMNNEGVEKSTLDNSQDACSIIVEALENANRKASKDEEHS